MKYIPIFLILICSILVYFFDLYHYIDLKTLKHNKDLLEVFIKKQFYLSLFLYSIIYIIIVSLSIPGATIMTIIGGFLFGSIIGTSLAVICGSVGAVIFTLAMKMASKSFVERQLSRKWVSKMKRGFDENVFIYLLTLRLIPIFPFFAINLGSSLLQVPIRTFFIATLIGTIPVNFVFNSMGIALRNIIDMEDFTPERLLDRNIIISFVGVGLLAMLPMLYKKMSSRT